MAKASTGEEITENSIPNLDNWGPDKYWIAQDWMEWHKIMKAKKGKSYADSTFLSWWNKQSFGAYPADAVSFNTTFRNYLKKENLYNAVSGIIQNTFGAVNDLVSSAGNVVSDAGKGAENLTKTLRIVIPILIGVFAVGLTVWAYKKFVK